MRKIDKHSRLDFMNISHSGVYAADTKRLCLQTSHGEMMQMIDFFMNDKSR